jgi:tripartite-type tricarboxylate transporter receptor subunit TctC
MADPTSFDTVRRLLLAGLFTAAAGLAQAQASAPIRLLVGFPPGGGTDAIARALAEKLKDQLGAPVVVENRAGAGGQIAAQTLKASAPDGHTFFLSHDHSISILPLVTKSPGFDPAVDFVLRIQPVDATISLYISAGVLKSRVFLGRSLSFLATAFSWACE